MIDSADNDRDELWTLRLTAEITAAYVSNNSVNASDIPALIQKIHGTLDLLARSNSAQHGNDQSPAVPLADSITDDYIICLEDGKKLKMLKRYLRSNYDMTPEEYRSKWNLSPSYPMVAPNYAAQRSEFAKKIGLGKSAKQTGKRPPKASAG